MSFSVRIISMFAAFVLVTAVLVVISIAGATYDAGVRNLADGRMAPNRSGSSWSRTKDRFGVIGLE